MNCDWLDGLVVVRVVIMRVEVAVVVGISVGRVWEEQSQPGVCGCCWIAVDMVGRLMIYLSIC